MEDVWYVTAVIGRITWRSKPCRRENRARLLIDPQKDNDGRWILEPLPQEVTLIKYGFDAGSKEWYLVEQEDGKQVLVASKRCRIRLALEHENRCSLPSRDIDNGLPNDVTVPDRRQSQRNLQLKSATPSHQSDATYKDVSSFSDVGLGSSFDAFIDRRGKFVRFTKPGRLQCDTMILRGDTILSVDSLPFRQVQWSNMWEPRDFNSACTFALIRNKNAKGQEKVVVSIRKSKGNSGGVAAPKNGEFLLGSEMIGRSETDDSSDSNQETALGTTPQLPSPKTVVLGKRTREPTKCQPTDSRSETALGTTPQLQSPKIVVLGKRCREPTKRQPTDSRSETGSETTPLPQQQKTIVLGKRCHEPTKRQPSRPAEKQRKVRKLTTDSHRYKVCDYTGRRVVNCTCSECIKIGGGKNICVHDRQRHKCHECGGKSLCVHSRQASRCKECNGSGICKHGRERWRCSLCHST